MFARRACRLILPPLVAALFSGSPRADGSGAIRAITRPSADITLSFVQPGRIVHVSFKEGDRVKAGEVLVRQDDAAEQVQLAQLRAQSDDTTQVQANEASLAQKKVDLEKLEKAAASHAATALEVEHARLDVLIARLSLELARFEHEQAGRKYEEQRIRLDHLRLKSPVDGRIEKVDIEVGESVNALADVVRVVQTDPLWIDAPVPLAQAAGVESGMKARIQFAEPGPTASTLEGRVVFVASVADAASATLRVRIEVPNPAGRPAGEHVLVTFVGDP